MNKSWLSFLQVDLAAADRRRQLVQISNQRNWGLALLLTGWLHLAAFGFCYYLTIVWEYHESAGYLGIWIAEILAMWLIFRICARRRSAEDSPQSLERFVCRVWIAYFILAFNLGSMNTLRGHALFEFFPAMASLASFAFIMMTLVLSWRYFGAVLVMFVSGLLMAAHLLHAYLIFGLAWWLVLIWIGAALWWKRRCYLIDQALLEKMKPFQVPRAAVANRASHVDAK